MPGNRGDDGGGNSRRDFLRQAGWLGVGAGVLASPWTQALASPTPHAAAVATTRSGKVRGYLDRGVRVFKGIPYGADTTARRFMPALPEAPWRGVREALTHGASAPQSGAKEPISEDCLFLNVYTPALGDGGRRPILFYIHGGGYNNGSGSDPLV